jgi:hypothetical protein
MSGLSIKDVELRISKNLQPSLKAVFEQAGYVVSDHSRVRVSLVDASGRKKRSNAKSDNWSPDSGWVQVWFEPADAVGADNGRDNVHLQSRTELPSARTAQAAIEHAPMAKAKVEPGLPVVIKALARAERTPGWSFVSLK